MSKKQKTKKQKHTSTKISSASGNSNTSPLVSRSKAKNDQQKPRRIEQTFGKATKQTII